MWISSPNQKLAEIFARPISLPVETLNLIWDFVWKVEDFFAFFFSPSKSLTMKLYLILKMKVMLIRTGWMLIVKILVTFFFFLINKCFCLWSTRYNWDKKRPLFFSRHYNTTQHSHLHTYTHTLCHTHSLSHILYHTLSITHSLSLSLSHTHTHTHTMSLSL